MERSEHETILKVLKTNTHLRRLYEEHQQLEAKLTRFQKKNFLTPEEEMELKRIKKKKLMGKDEMMQIIAHPV